MIIKMHQTYSVHQTEDWAQMRLKKLAQVSNIEPIHTEVADGTEVLFLGK